MQEAGQPSAPARASSLETIEEKEQSSVSKAQRVWKKDDITVQDIEMTIAVEEEKTRREWINIVNKHEGVKVSNKHMDTPACLA